MRPTLRRIVPVGTADLRLVLGSAGEPEISIYDEIGWWGITAEEFKSKLDAIQAERIHLRINSPGGDLFDGLAIYNAIREHPAYIVSHVDGLAASMASVVALAADEVQIADNAFFMVHYPWTLAIGNAADLRKTADTLDKLGASIAGTYEKKSGKSATQVAAWMEEETWFSAAEAKDAGLVDLVTGSQDGEPLQEVAARFDLSIFAHVPASLAGRAAPLADPPRVDENRAAALADLDLRRRRLELAARL